MLAPPRRGPSTTKPLWNCGPKGPWAEISCSGAAQSPHLRGRSQHSRCQCRCLRPEGRRPPWPLLTLHLALAVLPGVEVEQLLARPLPPLPLQHPQAGGLRPGQHWPPAPACHLHPALLIGDPFLLLGLGLLLQGTRSWGWRGPRTASCPERCPPLSPFTPRHRAGPSTVGGRGAKATSLPPLGPLVCFTQPGGPRHPRQKGARMPPSDRASLPHPPCGHHTVPCPSSR